MRKKKKTLQAKLFWVLSSTILILILLFILVNTFIYKPFYIYSKKLTIHEISKNINNYFNTNDYNFEDKNENLELTIFLEKIAVKNSVEISLKDLNNKNIYSSNKDFVQNNVLQDGQNLIFDPKNENSQVGINEVTDSKTGIKYLNLNEKLDNGYYLSMRFAISPIEESVKISNTFLAIIGGLIIIILGAINIGISKKFTEPIQELEEIAKKMANLDFSVKYKVKSENDEIDNLGKSMNLMSMQLEKTIRQLQNTNLELEKDIEKKSKIEEMRSQFISDVSHELKTPIALIQGYAEGLQENINSDEESRKFYTEVIIDEANKMDNLVKKLLELMKLEYCKREFNNTEFNIVELVKEVLRKSKVLLDEANVKVNFDDHAVFKVFADPFYIEQVVTNYVTNAIKNVEEVNDEKYIKISFENIFENNKNKMRLSVFNTGKNIAEEDLNRIWNRFYKADTSRNREKNGGTGIGLAFVKAIMNNYDGKYGVENKPNGVEFFIEL